MALLLIPIPFLIQSSIELMLVRACRSSTATRMAMAIFILVVVFFLDSFHKMLKIHSTMSEGTPYSGPFRTDSSEFESLDHGTTRRHHHHHHNSFQSSALYSALFYAQRNVYLTGMVLLLFL